MSIKIYLMTENHHDCAKEDYMYNALILGLNLCRIRNFASIATKTCKPLSKNYDFSERQCQCHPLERVVLSFSVYALLSKASFDVLTTYLSFCRICIFIDIYLLSNILIIG